MPAPAIIERAYDALTQAMRAAAQEWHAQWPQYEGYFDEWIAARVTVRTEFKGSSLLEAGDLVLVDPTPRFELGTPGDVRTWCPRSGRVVACPPENLGAIRVLP